MPLPSPETFPLTQASPAFSALSGRFGAKQNINVESYELTFSMNGVSKTAKINIAGFRSGSPFKRMLLETIESGYQDSLFSGVVLDLVLTPTPQTANVKEIWFYGFEQIPSATSGGGTIRYDLPNGDRYILIALPENKYNNILRDSSVSNLQKKSLVADVVGHELSHGSTDRLVHPWDNFLVTASTTGLDIVAHFAPYLNNNAIQHPAYQNGLEFAKRVVGSSGAAIAAHEKFQGAGLDARVQQRFAYAVYKFMEAGGQFEPAQLNFLFEKGILVKKSPFDGVNQSNLRANLTKEELSALENTLGVKKGDGGATPGGEEEAIVRAASDAAEVAAGTSALTRSEVINRAARWGVLGQTLGSQLGTLLAGDDEVVAGVSGAVLGQIGLEIGRNLGLDPAAGVLSAVRVGAESALSARGLATAIGSAGLGFVSSTITGELRQALNLNGLVGDVFGVMSGSVVNTIVRNISVGGVEAAFEGLDGAAFWATPEVSGGEVTGGAGAFATAAVASYLGAKLGALIVAPETQAAATLSSLGSAIGGWALSTSGVTIGTGATATATGLGASLFGGSWAALNIIAPGFGALFGFVFGSLIGNLFGRKKPKTPTASAETELQIPTARYELGTITSANNGSVDLVTSMAISARDTLNALIRSISFGEDEGFVSNLNGLPTDQRYGHAGNQIYVKINGVQNDFASADEAVEFGALTAIRNTKVVGGDIFAKRAILSSQALDLTALLGDLQMSADYRKYQENSKFIADELSGDWKSLSSAEHIFYDQHKELIEKIFARDDVPLSAADEAAYQADKSIIDTILDKAAPSYFAAAWTATLARVSELQLDRFAPSDFYGGLRGFADSFQLLEAGLRYEQVAADLDGADLTISVDAEAPEGVFSLLPQASLDGRSVSIANFLGAGLGYSAWDGGAGMSGANLSDASGGTNGQLIDDYGEAGGATYGGGDDIAIGSSFNDTLHGRSGWDWLDGGAGADLIYGGQDQDVLLGGPGHDTVHGDHGDDYLAGGQGADLLVGGEGKDVLVGGQGADAMYGEGGDDTFVLEPEDGGESDHMDGGAGSDAISFERFATGVNVSMRALSAGDTWVSIENVTGSRASDSIEGDRGTNVLRGLAGDDTLSGLEGDDVLEGGAGADFLAGGGGKDVASYEGSKAGVFVDLTRLEGFGGDADGDRFSSIENLRGSKLDDMLKGGAGINRIEGWAGDDWIVATAGLDVYDGGDGWDLVDYSNASSGVTLNLGGYTGASFIDGIGTAGMAAGQSLIKIEAAVGSGYDDNISAGDGAQTLTGGKGNDTLSGGGGADTYVFNRGDGADQIVEDTTGWNALSFGPDILFQDLLVATAGSASGYLDFYIRGTSDSVRIVSNWANPDLPKLKAIELAGGARLDLDQALNGVSSTDYDDNMVGVAGFGDMLFGNDGNDVMRTRSSGVEQISHVFVGGLGNDSMYGSTGDDSYGIDRGGVAETDLIGDGGGEDTVVFGPSVAAEDVIYEVVGTSLYIGARDPANPSLTASQVDARVLIADGAIRYVDALTGEAYFGGGMVEFVTAGGVSIDLRKLDLPWTEIEYVNYENFAPIILDLEGDGLDLSSIDETRVVARTAGGILSRVAWAGPTDGFLAVDRDGDGAINRLSEISFTQDKAGAETDLEGLTAWDSNADGVLDDRDRDFGKLLVWTDKNQNGRSTAAELKTLKAAGITSIDLNGQATGYSSGLTDESFIQNTLSYTTGIGKAGAAYDVSLARRLINSEGLYAGAYRDSWGALNEDGELGRVTNDAKLDAKGAGRPGQGDQELKEGTLGYDQVAAAADLDFADHDELDPVIGKLWEAKLDPAKRAEAEEQRKLQPTDEVSVAALAATVPGAVQKAAVIAADFATAGAPLDDNLVISPLGVVAGTTGNDSLSGTSGVDTLEGGLGNDTLAGAGGADTYIYSAGDGDDRVVEGATTGVDKLLLGSGLNPTNVVIKRAVSGDDATLSFIGFAGSITLTNQFYAPLTYGVEQIQFGDGTLWNQRDLFNAYLIQAPTAGNDAIVGTNGVETLAGGAGNDTLAGLQGGDSYLYNIGDGDDYIDEGANAGLDRIKFGLGISSTDLIVRRHPGDDTDFLITFGSGGGSIRINSQYYGNQSGLEYFEFSDGTYWTNSQLVQVYLSQVQTSGNDSVLGVNGEDTIQGGAGDDTVSGMQMSDVYIYNIGDGDDLIFEGVSYGAADRIKFGIGIDIDNLIVSRNPADVSDFVLSFSGATGSIVLDEQDYGSGQGVEYIEFSDGSVLTQYDVLEIYVAQAQTSGNDTLYGYAESNTYVFNNLSGDDVLYENAGVFSSADKLIFGPGLNASNVVLTRSGADVDDIKLSFTGFSGSLTLDEEFYGSDYGIEQIVFGDGTLWNKTDLFNAYVAQAQTGGNDTIYGRAGSNTFTINALAGADRIFEGPEISTTERLALGAGLNSSNVILTRSTSDIDDVTLTFAGMGGSLLLDEQFHSTGMYGVDEIAFGDGVVWSRARVLSELTLAYTAGSDTIAGGAGADIIRGGAGNDRLVGGGGADTYLYDPGDGSDTIVETAVAGTDVLMLTSVNAGDIVVGKTGADLSIGFVNYEGSIWVQNGAAGTSAGIESYQFEDGTIWTAAQMVAAAQAPALATAPILAGGLNASPELEDLAGAGPLGVEDQTAALSIASSPQGPAQRALAEGAGEVELPIGENLSVEAIAFGSADRAWSPIEVGPTGTLESASESNWWRTRSWSSIGDGATSGPLAALIQEMSQEGVPRTFAPAGPATAQLAQQQQLFRQAIAGFSEDGGAAPAIWARQGDDADRITLALSDHLRMQRHKATMLA